MYVNNSIHVVIGLLLLIGDLILVWNGNFTFIIIYF